MIEKIRVWFLPAFLVSLLFLTACSRLPSAPLSSPSGKYTLTVDLPGDAAGPTRRLSLRLNILEIGSTQKMVFQTGASDTQKWALKWTPTDVLVLYSSDVGTSSFDLVGGKIKERSPTPEEKEIGRQAYAEKYGRLPSS